MSEKEYTDQELCEFASVISLGAIGELKSKEHQFTVYTFEYNPCIHESGWITMSAHLSKANAYKAMRTHKLEAYAEYMKLGKRFRRIKFGRHESWSLGKMIILP